jgi:malate synthase
MGEMNMLDLLYTNYFNQLIRTHNSPVFVEKTILDNMTDLIKEHILSHTKEIRKHIEEYQDRKVTSRMTWDKEHYKKISAEKLEALTAFENNVRSTASALFIEKDFSKTDTDIDLYYTLPKSSLRQKYYELWEKVKNKDK